MKNFDEIILDLPEINLNEKRTRFGGCRYGENGFGGCYDSPGVTVTAPRGGGGFTSPIWSSPGTGNNDRDYEDNYGQSSGEWVHQPCLGCSEAESPRKTFSPLGRLILNTSGGYHNDGCGGQLRGELRYKVWQPCE